MPHHSRQLSKACPGDRAAGERLREDGREDYTTGEDPRLSG